MEHGAAQIALSIIEACLQVVSMAPEGVGHRVLDQRGLAVDRRTAMRESDWDESFLAAAPGRAGGHVAWVLALLCVKHIVVTWAVDICKFPRLPGHGDPNAYGHYGKADDLGSVGGGASVVISGYRGAY